jgi:hypothetical protein
MPRLMSEVFAIVFYFEDGKGKGQKSFFVDRFSFFVSPPLPLLRHKLFIQKAS